MTISYKQLAEKTGANSSCHMEVKPGNASDVNVEPVLAGSDQSKSAQNATSDQTAKVKKDLSAKGDAKKLDPEPVKAGSDTTSEEAISKAPTGSLK